MIDLVLYAKVLQLGCGISGQAIKGDSGSIEVTCVADQIDISGDGAGKGKII